MAIRNITQNNLIASHVSAANTSFTRMKGLLGRKSLSDGEALVITPCQSVHMLFMAFAIDVVFVDKDHNVIGLCRNLKPFQFSPVFFKSACAIELPAGTIVKTKTSLGDHIQL